MRAQVFRRIVLWTPDGLPAAARLYADAGFVETERLNAMQWGLATTDLRLELSL